VLRAAVKVFYERGYASATVQDIADELGILKGSLYHYIQTKEDLLLRLCESLHAEVDGILAEVRVELDLSPLERLDLYIRRQVLFNLDHLDRVTVYYSEMERLSGANRRAVVKRRKDHEQWVRAILREAQEDGTVDPELDPKLISNCVFATIVWTYRWYRPGGPATREDIARECSDFVLGGVAVAYA
jgi:AcrR family transcriptional regulator